MSIESLLIAAQFLESQEEGSEDQEASLLTTNDAFCNSPPSSSNSSNDSIRKFPTKGRQSYQRNGSRRSESNRSINREIHNRLEKNRRAQMKEGFERLKKLVPNIRSPKISSLALLKEVTNYVNYLKSEDTTLENQKKALELKQTQFLDTLKTLQKPSKSYRKAKKSSKTCNESTYYSDNEVKEEKVDTQKLINFSAKNDKNLFMTGETPTQSVAMENATRPSVVVSIKDESRDIKPNFSKESCILYTHLTSTTISSQTLPTTDVFTTTAVKYEPLMSTHTLPLTMCSSSKAAAETLLELNKDSFQSVERHDIVQSEFTEKDNVRKRKSSGEGTIQPSVIQEPTSKMPLISPPAITKAKNNKEGVLLHANDDKAKYVVAFRPCTIKNNMGYVAQDNKVVAPKVLLNATGNKSGSEQILLISGNQLNTNSGDFKSKLMVLENELKLISCKPVAKDESLNKYHNVIVNRKGYSFITNKGVFVHPSAQTSEIKTPITQKPIVPPQNEKKTNDIILQVPSTALPSFGLVLSQPNNPTFSELRLAPPLPADASKEKTFQSVNGNTVEASCLIKTNPQQSNFGLRCSDSKLYFIAVQNPNKTIPTNGSSV